MELSSQVRADERDALEKQQEKKRVKNEAMLKRRLHAATHKYVDKLYYREMYDSAACWRTCAQVNQEMKALGSVSVRLKALKDQIRMRVLGLGWDNCHHPWSKNGHVYTPDKLVLHLKDDIIKSM